MLYPERAAFVAESLQYALDHNDSDRCISIITDQITLMTSKQGFDDEQAAHELYIRKDKFAIPPEQQNTFDEYYKILYEALQQFIQTDIPNPDDPGTAVIHRIWIGRELSEDKLRKVMLANMRIADNWYDCRTGRKAKVKSILWTNNKKMMTGAVYSKTLCCSRFYPEMRDIAELVNCDDIPPLQKYIMSMIHENELSFACDILRLVIMFKFGGLFLGIPWEFMSTPPSEKFRPKAATLKLFTRCFTRKTVFLKMPFTALGCGYHRSFKEHFIPATTRFGELANCVRFTFLCGGDAMYIGHEGHQLFFFTLKIINELLDVMTPDPECGHFAGFRLFMRKVMPEKLRQGATEQQVFDLTLKNVGIGDFHPAVVLDQYPIMQSLMDLGYFEPKYSSREAGVEFSIPFRFRFNVVMSGSSANRIMTIKELNINRQTSLSWLRPNITSKLSSEL